MMKMICQRSQLRPPDVIARHDCMFSVEDKFDCLSAWDSVAFKYILLFFLFRLFYLSVEGLKLSLGGVNYDCLN